MVSALHLSHAVILFDFICQHWPSNLGVLTIFLDKKSEIHTNSYIGLTIHGQMSMTHTLAELEPRVMLKSADLGLIKYKGAKFEVGTLQRASSRREDGRCSNFRHQQETPGDWQLIK